MKKLENKTITLLADASLMMCAVFWGGSFAVMKSLLSVYPSFWLLTMRFGAASLLVLTFSFRSVMTASRRDMLVGLAIGASLFSGIGPQAIGLAHTTAANQAFLSATYVMFVPLMMWSIRGIFPGRLTLAASFVCLVGMALLTDGLSGTINIGDVLGIVSALFCAVQILIIGRFAPGCNIMAMTFAQFAAVAVLSALTSFALGEPMAFRIDRGLPELAFVSVFCSYLCFMTQNAAQKYTSESHAAMILMLESVFGLAGGMILLGESLNLRSSVGCVMILGSVASVELSKIFQSKPAAQEV